MLSTAHRRALGAAVLLTGLGGTPAVAGNGARVPSAPAVALAQHVTDAALPAASRGVGFVATGSDALSPDALGAARLALTPGYSAAALHRDGSALRATLVYAADGARDAVVVERTGTVAGDAVSFAPGAVVTGLINEVAAGTYRVRTASGASTVTATDAATAAGVAKNCVAICLTYATLSPKHQIVNGQGYGPGVYQVSLFLDGSATIPAARDITVPFATCSASQCQRITYVPSQTGTSYHTFAPLGCDQSRTVWGTIMYSTGWVNDSATVQIDNPGC